MDERKPNRRRKLNPKEIKALEKQRKKQQALNEKRRKQAAKDREAARKQARKNGHINEPRNPERKIPERELERRRRAEAQRREASEENKVQVQNIEVEGERSLKEPRRPDKNAERKARKSSSKRRKKSMPDIIEKETDKRVRNLEASDHKDGFYADEVEVRKEQARKARKKRREKMPKPISPQKRRARRIIAYVTIISTVIIVGVVLSLTVLFKTESIYVEGNKYYAEDTIIRLAQVREGDNIFMASMFGNAESVKDSLPYIKSASIHFRLPNSLVINVENAKEAQCVKTDGMYFKVSDENILLERVAEKQKNLTSLVAPTLKTTEVGKKVEFKDKSYTKALDELTECINTNKYKKITEINIKTISDISITYDNRIKIRIGLPEAIDYKLKTAFTIINEKLDPNHTGKIKGVLNVSKCNKTKKSYFKEGSLEENEQEDELTQPTTTVTEETTVRTTYIAAENEETTEGYDYDSDDDSGDDGDDYSDEEPNTEAQE